MNDYLEWLTAGLIFLLILGAYDARAAQMDLGGAGCESSIQCAFRSAPHCLDPRARPGFVCRQLARSA